MSIRPLKQGEIAAASQRNVGLARIPAPVKGINAKIALSDPDPDHCLYTYNLLPYEFGMRIRSGYREWQVDIETAPGEGLGVRTVIPFNGTAAGSAGDKLFAVTNEGIWDTTISGDAPILKVAFADAGPNSGYGTYTQYTDDSEESVLFYADSINGLFSYDHAGDSWAQTTGISGPIVTNIRWVATHKEHLWVLEEGSSVGWYLPVGAKQGTASPFYAGSKFPHGGSIAGVFSWSVDGGSGLDDMFVIVSKAGDVAVYEGTDPAQAATWALRATYFIGEVPIGASFGAEQGGELFLISSFGISSLNQLLEGVTTVGMAGGGTSDSPATKITLFIRDQIKISADVYGWRIASIPSEGALLIQRPILGSEAHIQYYYNNAVNGWAFWRGVPIMGFDSWLGRVAIGTEDNRMLYMDTTVDNVQLAPADPLDNGQPIPFSVLTSFQPIGGDVVYKKVSLIRPDFISISPPSYRTEARYDYDVSEILAGVQPPEVVGGAWDVGIWDSATWSAGIPEASNSVGGSWGYGRYVAITMSGRARESTRLIGWDVMFTTGGPLV